MRHFACAVIVLIIFGVAAGQSGGAPTTQEQRQSVLRLAASYPANPQDPALDQQATAATKMLQDAPDIPVALCPEHLPWIEKKKYKYAHELTIAYYLGSGAYAIQHSEAKPSRLYYPALMAGSEAAIRAYQTILGQDAGAKLDKMSEWIDQQKAGKLMANLEANCSSPNPARSRPKGPSTAEERQHIIAFASQLQQNPIDPILRPEYQELFFVIVQATDFSVEMCTISTPWMGDKPEYKYGPDLTGLNLLAMSAFVLQNPGKDGAAQNRAGLAASLRGYEAILQQEPTAHSKTLDDVLNVEKQGKLDEWFKDRYTKTCKKK